MNKQGWYYVRINDRCMLEADRLSMSHHVLYRGPPTPVPIFSAFAPVRDVSLLEKHRMRVSAHLFNPSACRIWPDPLSSTLVMATEDRRIEWHWTGGIIAVKKRRGDRTELVCWCRMTLPQFLSRVRLDDQAWAEENGHSLDPYREFNVKVAPAPVPSV
jgi:hypothetical protein